MPCAQCLKLQLQRIKGQVKKIKLVSVHFSEILWSGGKFFFEDVLMLKRNKTYSYLLSLFYPSVVFIMGMDGKSVMNLMVFTIMACLKTTKFYRI